MYRSLRRLGRKGQRALADRLFLHDAFNIFRKTNGLPPPPVKQLLIKGEGIHAPGKIGRVERCKEVCQFFWGIVLHDCGKRLTAGRM